MTILTGNTFVNIALASLAAVITHVWAGKLMPNWDEELVILFEVIIVSIVVLIFGEILPKSIGSKLALQVSLASAPLLHFLSMIMRPLLHLLEQVLPVITAESELTTDEEEILAREASRAGGDVVRVGQQPHVLEQWLAHVRRQHALRARDRDPADGVRG